MVLGRLLVTLATLLVLLLGAAFLAPAFVNWTSYRPDIEQAAGALLGRKIKIVGDIDIALLPEPHLQARKVVAEGGTADAAQMTAEGVDLTLSLQSLLSGVLEASKLKLVNPYLILDLSKPVQQEDAPAKGLPLAAGVTSLEIEGGRISIYADASKPEALILTGVDGTLSAPQQRGQAYRFAGRVSQDSRRFDVKFLASPQGRGLKLAGSAIELKSKAVLQADGVLSMAEEPVFEGVLAMAPQGLLGAPLDIQVKAAGKLNREGALLSDMSLTVDAGNRPQVLTGSANVVFTPGTSDITLRARSLDADALVQGIAAAPSAPGKDAGWDSVRAAADQLFWLFPDFGVHLVLAADQIQLRGEVIEGVKFDGTRMGGKWLFEDAQATLPGETALRLTGALKKAAAKAELLARVAVEGKNLSRLNRWIAPDAAKAKSAPAKAFTAGGLLTLSDTVTAVTDVKGEAEGAPFSASLRLDRTPARKLKLSLGGDSFDLSGLEPGQNGGDPLSSESVKDAWQAVLEQLTPLLGDDPAAFDTADIAISAKSIRTGVLEARNVAVELRAGQDLLTIVKLSADTPEGLSLSAEGAVPMRNLGQGRFNGRIEAPSPSAVLKLAALTGYDADSFAGGRAADLAPASVAVDYRADEQANASTAQLSGTLGGVRLDGRVQSKGSLSDWRMAQFSFQASLSSNDGAKLAALLSQKGTLPPGAAGAPGMISIRASGVAERFDASFTVKAPSLQAQIDGAAEYKTGFSFSGKAQAASPSPEHFLPPPLLALLGGERQANLKIESAIAFGSGHLDASKLKAESPKNSVTGRLALGLKDRLTEINADLKASQFSLPAIMGYLLSPPPSDRVTLALANVIPAPSQDIWSDRPFSSTAFQDTAAKVTLAAKAIKLSESLTISDARVAASLDAGRLAVEKLEGKALGGDFSASFSLDAQASPVAASAIIALSKADLAALPMQGTPAMLTGKASLSLRATGQGMSPRGVLSVLQGRGLIALSDGQLAKFSSASVQKSADDMLASPLPLTEDAIKKKALDAVQSADLKYRHLKIPFVIRDATIDVRRASFRGRDSTVRMEGYLDLSSMQADTIWQAGVGSDKRMRWPPVKVQIGGPLRELGAKPRSLASEDFVRAVLVRKMEGDITRLENLNKPQATKQDALSLRRRPDDPAKSGASANGSTEFEKRMRDTLSKSMLRPDTQ